MVFDGFCSCAPVAPLAAAFDHTGGSPPDLKGGLKFEMGNKKDFTLKDFGHDQLDDLFTLDLLKGLDTRVKLLHSLTEPITLMTDLDRKAWRPGPHTPSTTTTQMARRATHPREPGLGLRPNLPPPSRPCPNRFGPLATGSPERTPRARTRPASPERPRGSPTPGSPSAAWTPGGPSDPEGSGTDRRGWGGTVP